MEITLLYSHDCPNWQQASHLLDRLATVRADVSIQRVPVETDDEAQQCGFRGSPTILIDGVDPWATDDMAFGLSCRIYETPAGPAGSPAWEQLLEAVAGRGIGGA